jgi:hypothetical protein
MTDNFRRGRRPQSARIPRKYDLVDTDESDYRLPSNQWPRWAWVAIAVSIVLLLASTLLILMSVRLGSRVMDSPSRSTEGSNGDDGGPRRALDCYKRGVAHSDNNRAASSVALQKVVEFSEVQGF